MTGKTFRRVRQQRRRAPSAPADPRSGPSCQPVPQRSAQEAPVLSTGIRQSFSASVPGSAAAPPSVGSQRADSDSVVLAGVVHNMTQQHRNYAHATAAHTAAVEQENAALRRAIAALLARPSAPGSSAGANQ
jgi:hypothetical protein